jgi:hypothetical protein
VIHGDQAQISAITNNKTAARILFFIRHPQPQDVEKAALVPYTAEGF